MKLLIKNTTEILDNKLSLCQRGLMVTIILLKDPDSKLTLAKVKAKVNMKQVKEDLIHLHEVGFIKWSGYNSAIKSIAKVKSSPDVLEAVNFMNILYGRKFDPNSQSTTKNLRNRLEEHGLDVIKKVIANRYVEWKDDAIMSKHLNPTTIFRPTKFDKYLEEALRTKQGESFVSAEKIGLKNGDFITLENSETFSDEDVYSIKTYQCDSDGNKRGSGMSCKRYGKDIKKMIKMQERLANRGTREHIYQYINK